SGKRWRGIQTSTPGRRRRSPDLVRVMKVPLSRCRFPESLGVVEGAARRGSPSTLGRFSAPASEPVAASRFRDGLPIPVWEVFMKTVRICCVAAVAGLILAPIGRAQEPPKPGPEHEVLKKLEGTWEATMKFGGMESKGTMIYKMDLGGLWLTSNFEGDFA